MQKSAFFQIIQAENLFAPFFFSFSNKLPDRFSKPIDLVPQEHHYKVYKRRQPIVEAVWKILQCGDT